MLNILLPKVKYLLKLEQVCIDNNVFRLHYKATAILLAISSIVITSKQYIGDPIECILDTSLDRKAMNTYCWITSTFTLSNTQPRRTLFPGVGPESEDTQVVHQKYYQWVCFILAIQAAMFIFPHCLWRVWEGGRIKMLVGDLCSPLTESWTAERKTQMVRYLTSAHLYNLNLYAIQFLFCELLNAVNIFFQIYVWHKVLGNKFFSFGPDVIRYAYNDKVTTEDPVNSLFPKITKCEFRYFGPSGTAQQIDGVCVLPLNMVNEKMFIFLWFWFFILAMFTAVGFVYDIILFSRPAFRMYVLQAQARYVPRVYILRIVRKGTLGHWFLLLQLSRNLNPFVLADLLKELAEKLEKMKVNV